MKNGCVHGVLAVLLLGAGCAGMEPVYVEVPTDGVELVDFEGEVQPEDMKERSEEDLIRARMAEGYRLVGRAEFRIRGREGWTVGMVRKGREIKAAKIDYKAVYDPLESCVDSWGVQSSTMAGLAGGERDMSNPLSVPSVSNAPAADTYVYQVYYFKKTAAGGR